MNFYTNKSIEEEFDRLGSMWKNEKLRHDHYGKVFRS